MRAMASRAGGRPGSPSAHGFMPAAPAPKLDHTTLTPIVRQALGRADAEVVNYTCEPLGSSYGAGTAGIFRIEATASELGSPAAPRWSVVLKVCRARLRGADPGGWTFGPREAHAYGSGLLADLPAPRCFAVDPQPDGTYRIWLERLEDAYHGRWPLERYGTAARHLGQFNGAYMAGRPIPPFPWI